MDQLTERQRLQLNNLNTNTQDMDFGDKLVAIITEVNKIVESGAPVNAANASKVLTISDVVIDGETVIIDNPAVAGSLDTYEFKADTAQEVTHPGNIPVNITAYTTKATGTLTLATQPISGDKFVIGEKEYTFVPVGTATADGEISISADLPEAKLAVVAAINGTDGVNEPHPLVSAAAFAVNNCAITALIGGAAGNSIATTETFDAVGNVFAAVALATGADCSAANAVTALVAAITASDTQGVGAADGAGDTVVLTADLAGVIGNSIIIAETLANGAFAGGAVLLSGGVNGTVGLLGKAFLDSSYLYVCIANNTISSKNWRRISVGSAY